MQEYSYYECRYSYYINIIQAAHYSGISVKKWLNLIDKGIIVPTEMPVSDNTPDPSVIRISINYLPKYAAEQYLQDNLLRGSYFQMDFIGYLARHGEKNLLEQLDLISKLKTAILTKNVSGRQVVSATSRIAKELSYSVSSLYRKEALFMNSDLRALIQRKPLYHSKSLCALSEHYITYFYSLSNAGSQAHILRQLTEESLKLGKEICTRCPFHSESSAYKKLHDKYPSVITECLQPKNGMVVPNTRYPVNRFIQSLNRQQIYYGRKGYNAWADTFLHKTKRERPPQVNAVWFGDHHIADVIVIVGTDSKTQQPILARPWLTVVTDAATEAVIGSVVSIHPNSQTIAESFCRAAAFTISSPFYGLPEVFYIDRGKDYKATLIEGRDFELRQRLPQNLYLNRALADHPLLPALNVTIHHALPKTGRSKVIERVFGTITREYFQSIPGWTGNCPDNRPFDYYREQKNLLAANGLWTLEQFAVYWFETVIPSYNQFSPDKNTLSPLQLYEKLPRADTITPDWNTLSVFMVEKSSHKVHPQGIKYRNEFYWHPFLRDYIGEYVQIYDFDQSFCHSISVLAKGKYLCQAEPLVHQGIIEADRLKLIHHLEEQKQQKRIVSKQVSTVKLILKSAKVNTSRYVDAPEPSSEGNHIAYVESIDTERDSSQAVVLSPTANTLAEIRDAQLKAIDNIIRSQNESPLNNYYIQKTKSHRSIGNDGQ